MEAATTAPQMPLSFPPAQAAESKLAYIYPQCQPAAGQSQAPRGMMILMPAAIYYQNKPPNYNYQPSNFKVVSILTILICGFFSPPTLVLSIPALMFSIKSQKSANQNATKEARRQGMISAYLNFTAITISLVVACWLIGLIVGIEGREYSLQQCINTVRARNGGELPSISTSSSAGRNTIIRC